MVTEEPPTFDVAESADGVALRGEIDLAATDELRRRFEAVVTPGRHLVVDLSGVSFMDSSGIEALCVARRRALREGGSVSLRGPNPVVLRTLEITGVDALFEIDLAAPVAGDGRR
jgi:anti-anti-sigma factor